MIQYTLLLIGSPGRRSRKKIRLRREALQLQARYAPIRPCLTRPATPRLSRNDGYCVHRRPMPPWQALEGDPDCAPAAYNLNTALRMVGRQEEAISFSWRVIRGNLENLPGRASAGVIERCVNFSSAATAAEAAAAANAAAPSPRWINHVEGRGVVDPSPVVHGVGAPRLGADKVSRPVGGGGCPEGVAATRGEAADAGSLTVACVRWGDKYGPEYVERLAFGVRRNLSRRYGFVCFTDDVTALNGMVGVEARPLGEGCKGWRGWWHKAFLFSR